MFHFSLPEKLLTAKECFSVSLLASPFLLLDDVFIPLFCLDIKAAFLISKA